MKLLVNIEGEEQWMSGSFEITEKQAKVLTENSVERVINETLKTLEVEGKITVAEEDLTELKPLICGIWSAAQNAIIAKRCEVLK